MEISVKSSYGIYLTVEDYNVKIEEDIESRTYHKSEDGKTDFTKAPIRDVNTDILEQFSNVLYDMIDYRKQEFDSSYLVEGLFEKLPKDKIQELLTKLNRYYGK